MIYRDKSIIGVIAVKERSNRFKNKNIYEYDGYPMFFHNVRTLLNFGIIPIVVTNSEFVKSYSNKYDIIWREDNLSDDEQPIYDILKYVYHSVPKFDIMVNILANTIDMKVEDIKKAVDCLIDNDLWEVRTIDRWCKENGCMVLSDNVFKNRYQISAYVGAVETNSKEIHYEREIKRYKR